MDERQKMREQAWAVMKHMHDNPGEPQIQAASGWCAPSEVIYPQVLTEADVITGRFR